MNLKPSLKLGGQVSVLVHTIKMSTSFLCNIKKSDTGNGGKWLR